jgi:hypothetical protein
MTTTSMTIFLLTTCLTLTILEPLTLLRKQKPKAKENTYPQVDRRNQNKVSCNTNLSKDAISDIVFDRCINNYKDVVSLLSSKVKHEDQFFLTMRRNALFPRLLSLWKRQALHVL